MAAPQWPIDRKQPFRSVVFSVFEKGTLNIMIRDVFVDYLNQSLNENERKKILEDIAHQQAEKREMESNPANPFYKDELSFEHYCSMKYKELYNHIMKMIDSLGQLKSGHPFPMQDLRSKSQDWHKSLVNKVVRSRKIIWLDLQNPLDSAARKKWIGSSSSAPRIFREKRVSGNINQMCALVRGDLVFRRAIIALPDILPCFVHELGCSDRHMMHTCMLALTFERSYQLERDCARVEMWASDQFRSYIKYDEIEDLPSYIKRWGKEFIADFSPR